MKTIYNSDRPISIKEEDKFNRFNFSKRVAETIIQRDSEKGLVIGIYGVWGEGKTSILNIIENELQPDTDIIIIKFNPWRFTTQDELILNFFESVSNALDKQLKNNTEKLGSFIQNYGSLTQIFNGLDLSKLGDSLSYTKLEELKDRVNEFIKESGKRVVVIIDDIDRLDKKELFSLFKLIKLTGDFHNTYYILSFDDEMVASAIGENYANGGVSSGYNFLEKIIQVPLRIPKALNSSLLSYTFELINDVLKHTETELTETKGQHIGKLISKGIIPKISTPRLAIRYANSLSFLLPLLKGEVNYADLILFEGVKLFYPSHYEFIKKNSDFFIKSFKGYDGKLDSDKVAQFKSHLELLNSNLSPSESKSIIELLIELFPYLNEAIKNSFHYNGETKWIKEKKIGTPAYFNRYFLYSVPDNEISDVYFDNFIDDLNSKSIEELTKQLDDIFVQIGVIEFLRKISFYEDDMIWERKSNLINLITTNEDKFENKKGVFFGIENPKKQAAITINRLIKFASSTEEQINIAKDLMSGKVSFEFSFEILYYLKLGKSEAEKLFTESVDKELNEILLDRAIIDCSDKKTTIFDNYDGFVFSLLEFWYEKDNEELKKYVNNLIDENPAYVKNIIYSLTNSIISSSRTDGFKVDFKQDSYNLMKKYFDLEKLYASMMQVYEYDIDKENVVFFDHSEGQTEINALRQFKYWHDESNDVN